MNSPKPLPDFSYETQLISEGFFPIAGIDEAGRGPLAGPVVAAAVILDPSNIPKGLNDSKKLKPTQREALFTAIMASAKAVGVSVVDVETIDRINILQANFIAMREALANLKLPPAFALACYSRSSGPFPWFKAITPEIDGRQAFSAERRLAVGEAAGRSTSPRAAPKARPPGPRGDISVAPSGTVSCPRPCLTSAPCSVRPPVPESPVSAERRSDEQPPLDTPRRDPNSPAQEGPEDSDHEQALAGSKPRRSDRQGHCPPAWSFST